MGPQAGPSTNTMVTVKNETSYKSPPSSVSDMSQQECETARGRRQDRESTSTAKAEDESDDNIRRIDGLPGKPRKRKRSRKGLEKNFPCTFEGCGKSYSRAEHLYRHRLNRKPALALASPAPIDKRQIPRRKSTNVTFPAVSGNLSGRICVLGIGSAIPPVVPTCNEKIRIYRPMRVGQRFHPLQAVIASTSTPRFAP